MSAVLNQEKKRTGRTPRPPERRQVLSPAQSRTLIGVAFRVPGVLLAIITTVVLVTLVSVNSELTGTFGAIAGLWFAVHLVPLSIAGTSLGVFPLLPTLVVAAVVVRRIARTMTETTTRRDCAWIVGAAVLGPLVVTALALAVAADASAAIGLSSPHALVAFAWVAGVHAVSAGIGVCVGTWNSDAVAERVPTWIGEIVTPTIRAASVLVAGGGAIVLVAMIASWSTMEMLLESGNGFVGFLGLTVLSVLYLPNVVLGSLAVAVGSSSHIGDVTVSLFQSVGGPVPPLPILSVLPEGAAQTAWMLMLIVPICAGILLGRECARRSVDVHYALSSVWLGAAVIGLCALVLGFAAGGNLGTFGTVQVTVWSFGLLVFAWLAVVGSIAAAVTVWRGGSKELPVPDVAPAGAVAVAAIGPPVVHEERAVDAEVVEEPDMVEAAPAVVDQPADDPAEDIVDAEVVEVPDDEQTSDEVDTETAATPDGDDKP
ncbi:DUF6350 family protein [Rhodococcus sovatensis]|uniref:DUF6350 family protein n=1 Tax=Rhodococcus sovatensis TaxID=1805840 RepID=A0ABZ2PS66_9NOCA